MNLDTHKWQQYSDCISLCWWTESQTNLKSVHDTCVCKDSVERLPMRLCCSTQIVSVYLTKWSSQLAACREHQWMQSGFERETQTHFSISDTNVWTAACVWEPHPPTESIVYYKICLKLKRNDFYDFLCPRVTEISRPDFSALTRSHLFHTIDFVYAKTQKKMSVKWNLTLQTSYTA